MTKKQRTRQRAVLLGVVLLTIGAGGGVLYVIWPELQVRRTLEELRAEPTLLFEYYQSVEPLHREAADRFLDERPAKELVFDEYLAEYDRAVAKLNLVETMNNWAKNKHLAGFVALHEGGMEHAVRRNISGSGNFGQLGLGPEDPERRKLLLELIDRCVGEIFTHPKLRTYVFQLVRVESDRVAEPPWPQEKIDPKAKRAEYRSRGHANHVCFFRIDPNGMIPIDH